MTGNIFATVFIFGAGISSLLTQAIKKACENAGKEYKPNMIALINALVVGCGGTAVLYTFNAIPWTVNNIICLILMGVAVWMASMVGYDKVIQTLQQLGILPVKKEGEGSNGEA